MIVINQNWFCVLVFVTEVLLSAQAYVKEHSADSHTVQ